MILLLIIETMVITKLYIIFTLRTYWNGNEKREYCGHVRAKLGHDTLTYYRNYGHY
jgi:hypothetical protein